jgi:cytochrome c biogenesis protein CcdA
MKNTVCALTPEQADRRGVAWVIGSFVLCPCHLPITLWVIGAVLSGTALGALVRGHLYLAGAIISIAWLGGTLHGFNLMRRARIDAYANGSRSKIFSGSE